jgi:hypothetical protein
MAGAVQPPVNQKAGLNLNHARKRVASKPAGAVCRRHGLTPIIQDLLLLISQASW